MGVHEEVREEKEDKVQTEDGDKPAEKNEEPAKLNNDSSNGGSWFGIISLIVVILVILSLVGITIYRCGKTAGMESVEITRDELKEILAEEFSDSEIVYIMEEINNQHYEMTTSIGRIDSDIIIHPGHTPDSNLVEVTHDTDIRINLYYSVFDHEWSLSSYTWPDRLACSCDECNCTCRR